MGRATGAGDLHRAYRRQATVLQGGLTCIGRTTIAQLPVDAARARIHQPVTHERDRACGLIGARWLAAQLQPRLCATTARGHRHQPLRRESVALAW